MEILSFLAGILLISAKSAYFVFIPIIFVLLKRRSLVMVWFLCGMVWAFFHQWWVYDVGMPEVRVLSNVNIYGTISSIPKTGVSSQFHFAMTKLNDQEVKATLLLTCYRHCPVFKAGQTWEFKAKLKKPENLANPGGYDFVRRLNAEHIYWVGYIKPPLLKLSEREGLLTLREKLSSGLNQLIPNKSILGIFQALTFGITNNIAVKDWDLFRRTGTTHLIVISGSHIGLIAGFCYGLMKWLWSRSSRLCLRFPAVKSASIIGFLSAFIYAFLAGFDPPVQRSLLGCFFFFIRHFISNRFTIWQAWRYGLFMVLLYEPHVVLLPGFYLSFIATALLILVNYRFSGRNIKKFLTIQFGCLLGLMPLTLYLFGYGALNGFIANFLAIPFVGFLIVPLALVSLILWHCFTSTTLIKLVSFLIDCLFNYLQWVDSLSGINFEFYYPNILLPLALILAMYATVFLPIISLFPAILVLGLSAIFSNYPRINPGDVQVDVLDVGQGLAVIINTAKHSLIYDTGMKFYHGGDMGKLAIIPYLNTLRIKKIDKVIISHPDLDHRGGLSSLEKKYFIEELIVDKVAFYHRGKSCHQYPAWSWDGVSFRFYSISKKFRDKNNSSCVLQIENARGKVLLTGDIEKIAEDFLVKNYSDELRSNVLLVPHHGSKTSTSLKFIEQVKPQYAIISSGLGNRFHFPHPKTLDTLEAEQVSIFNTATCGMVTVKLIKQEKSLLLSCQKRLQIR